MTTKNSKSNITNVQRLGHVAIRVQDVQRAKSFYINLGMKFFGRSDTTLNPRGIRIGTSEIYRQINKFDEVIDSLAVSHGDERIILFVKLAEKQKLDTDLIKKYKKNIKENTTSNHVPKLIIQVPDLPITKSGKLSEMSVKRIINNQELNNIQSLENPESIEFFRNLNL